MAIKHIIIFALSFVLFGSVSAQQVKLSRLSRALGQDSIIISNASGVAGWYPKSSLGYLSGSGTSGHVAVWSGTSLTSTGWEMAATWLQSQSTFGPALRLTNCNFTFNGDNDTGIKRIGADIVGIHAGDATNPLITIDGPGEAIYFDPDDDGTDDVTISATKTSVELLNIGGFDTDAPTHRLGHDGNGDVTQTKITFGQLSFDGSETLTSTTGDTLFNVIADEIEVGDITVEDTNGQMIVGWTGHAEVTFSTTVDAGGSSYSGDVDFSLFVGGSYYTPVGTDVMIFAASERKAASFSVIVPVTSGNAIQVVYTLGTSGTLYAVRPFFTVKRI